MDTMLDKEPYHPTGRQIGIKSIIGFIIGISISFLTFITLILVGGIIQEAILNTYQGNTASYPNPLLPFVLIIIAFLTTIVGMLLLGGIYHLLYTDKYYDMGKIFSLTLLINVTLFVLFLPLYGIFTGDIQALFFILAFHSMFSVFISYTAVEATTNPNYSTMHLIGTSIGFTMSIILFALLRKILDNTEESIVKILLSVPSLLIYFCLPLFHDTREVVYYKFYTLGNNFLYTPSISEISSTETNDEDIVVED